MPSSVLPATTISPPGHDALDRFGDPRLVLAAVPSGEHQRAVKVCSFDARRHLKPGVRQGAKMRAKALHEMQFRAKTFRQPEAGLRAEEKKTACTWCFEVPGFERMEKSGQRFRLHCCSVLLSEVARLQAERYRFRVRFCQWPKMEADMARSRRFSI